MAPIQAHCFILRLRWRWRRVLTIILLAALHRPANAQISSYPYIETFDRVTPSALPLFWSSSQNRKAGSDDFTITTSLPNSPPHAVLSTNASIEQFLISPFLDFSNVRADSLFFSTRRSSSHRGVLAVEASVDSGKTFTLPVGDVLGNAGTSNYVLAAISLPEALNGNPWVRFRWRVIPQSDGSTATLRIDDIRVTARYNRDVKLVRLYTCPANPVEGDSIVLHAIVTNVGLQPVEGLSMEVFLDADRDSVPRPEERVGTIATNTVIPGGDSTDIGVQLGAPPAGRHAVIARLFYEPDGDTINDRGWTTVSVGYALHTLIVNEIMFAPFAGAAEYIELVIIGDNDVDLSGWTLADRKAGAQKAKGIAISEEGQPIRPWEYVILGSDSSLLTWFPYLRRIDSRLVRIYTADWLALNNEGDDIIIRDPTGHVIDSVAYSPLWHNPGVEDRTGRSLEKIRPASRSNDARNWSTCALSVGGTPGMVNSIYAPATGSPDAQLSILPNPFSPDGDGAEDFAVISYRLMWDVSMLSVKIYDIRGRLVRHLVNNEPTGARGEVVWDGRDDGGRKARIGPYVVLLEALNDPSGVISVAKGLVVLAARL